MTPRVGIEPTTLGLRVPCSTDWANQARWRSTNTCSDRICQTYCEHSCCAWLWGTQFDPRCGKPSATHWAHPHKICFIRPFVKIWKMVLFRRGELSFFYVNIAISLVDGGGLQCCCLFLGFSMGGLCVSLQPSTFGSIKTAVPILMACKCQLSIGVFSMFTKELEPFVKAMYRKLEPFVKVLTYQVLSSSKIASPGPIYLI